MGEEDQAIRGCVSADARACLVVSEARKALDTGDVACKITKQQPLEKRLRSKVGFKQAKTQLEVMYSGGNVESLAAN